MLKDIVPRLYQETILATCVNKNTLVVLPTGMGKTAVALMLAAQRLKNYPNSKILFLAPTKPLAEQHLETFKKHFDFDNSKFALFTGNVAPEKRAELWKNAQVIFSTPQGLENDVISDRIRLEETSLLIFDEAHKATGEYAYSFIAKQYDKKARWPKILALTASPGNDLEKIQEICKNLFIEEVEIRTENDPDVKQYVQSMELQWAEIHLPSSFKEIRKFLDDCFKSKLRDMKSLGYLNSMMVGKKDLLMLAASLHKEISGGIKDMNILKAVSLSAEALKVYHAIELIETQGIKALYNYFEKMQEEAMNGKSKAVQNLVRDLNFKSAFIKTKTLYDTNVEHPKLAVLRELIQKEAKEGVKIIIFNNYRDTASKIVEELNKINGVSANIFVGQASKKEAGMSQKSQKEMLDKFRNGEFNVLVATSVAEEGLDIPRVDLVVFYEPIPSAIRSIQRRGRTGRQEKGRVIVLMTKDTRDEIYRWSAFHKEKKMHRVLGELKRKLTLSAPRKERPLTAFSDEIKIFADHREKSSGVVKELIETGVSIKLDQLEVADYVLSGRVAVEYKAVPDFVDSLIDGRLLNQIKKIKDTYERPIIIVEGTEDIYSQRNVHPNAIRGMLATIAVSYGIPILWTKNAKETAALLAVIAKREQDPSNKEFNPHADRKPVTLKELQEYVISSLPSVGPSLAKDLLKSFKTIKNIVNASEDELKNVENVGEKIAKNIKNISDSEYREK